MKKKNGTRNIRKNANGKNTKGNMAAATENTTIDLLNVLGAGPMDRPFFIQIPCPSYLYPAY